MTRGRGAGAKRKVKPQSPLNSPEQQLDEETQQQTRNLKLRKLRKKLAKSTQIVNASQTDIRTRSKKKKIRRKKTVLLPSTKSKSKTDVQAQVEVLETEQTTSFSVSFPHENPSAEIKYLPIEFQAEKSTRLSIASIQTEPSARPVQSTKSIENNTQNVKRSNHKTQGGDKNEKDLVPLGFVIIPKDSEPLIDDADAYLITWAQFFRLRTCSSVIFFESCLIYYFLPINLILGVVFLIWSYNEKVESLVVFLNYSPMSISTLISLIGLNFLITSILLSFATSKRRGMLIILSTFSILLGLVFFSLLSMFLVVYSNENEVIEYLEEIFDAYQKEGQETLTQLTDLLHRQFECCGIINATYWRRRMTIIVSPKIPLPHTCCESYYLKKAKHSDDLCYKTNNNQDTMHWTYHTNGCAKELIDYFRRRSKLHWTLVISGSLVTFVCLIFTLMYFIRVYSNLSSHVHPKTRTLVDEIVEKAEDDIFGSGFQKDAFDEDVKDFVQFHLSRCHTIDEVQQFLSATADVRTYMRSLGPGEFARDILSRNEELLGKFETVLKRLGEKKEEMDRQMLLEGRENQDKLLRLERATRNWKNMKRKVILLRRFTTTLNEFVELRKNEEP